MNSAGEVPAVAVGAVVFDRGERVLLVRRGRPPRAGEWSLPGGRVERGETPEAAVVREVLEETGLVVSVRAPLGVVRVAREGYCYDIHEFVCTREGAGDPAAADDAMDVAWASQQDLGGLGVSADEVQVIGRARSLAL
jgi:8-oxo-dGTP diphosphatase